MKKIYCIIRSFLGIVLIAGISYILILIFKNPSKPNMPLLKIGNQKINNVLKQIRHTPLLYPTQRKRIINYLSSLDSQIVEGFSSIIFFSKENVWLTYRWNSTHKRIVTWIANNYKQGEVIWNTATCIEKKKTSFVFSGGLGANKGEAEIYLSEKPIMVFETGPEVHAKIHKEGQYELRFFPLREENPQILIESGIFCLTVPESDVSSGKSLKLKVRGKEGANQWSYFGLINISDTLKPFNRNLL